MVTPPEIVTPPDVPTPRIDVVGLGPAGPELITIEARRLMDEAAALFLRTRRHPAAAPYPTAASFDHHYEAADTFDGVYRAIVEDLVAAALALEADGDAADTGSVVYAVPGSPSVAEARWPCCVSTRRWPAGTSPWSCIRRCPSSTWPSPAWGSTRWRPASGWSTARPFAVDAAGERGPLLVAQCWSTGVLSDIKLSVESGPVDR